jgi:flagellar transcriptional activator FlhC
MATRRELSIEIRRYRQAEALLQLGLRVPLVCEMTRLSHWFLRKLALEVRGEAPSKGQVPNSELWYLRGRNNLHSSLFLALYRPLRQAAGADSDASELLVLAFCRYREIVAAAGLPEVLSPDRAWWLLKSMRIASLKPVVCRECQGRYLMHQGDLGQGYRCVCCLARAALRRQLPPPGSQRALAAVVPCGSSDALVA